MIENESGDIVAVDDSQMPINADAPEKEVVTKVAEPEIQEEIKADGEEVKNKKLGGWARKNAKLERELAELKQQIAAKPVDIEPQLKDYTDWNDYSRAIARYEAAQVIKVHQEGLTKTQEAIKEAEIEKSWEAKVESLDEKQWDSFQRLVDDYKDVDIRTQIIKSAKNSDIGPQILLHLDKNPDLMDKLNSKDISDLAIKRTISSIESELMSNQKPAVKGSKSPAPITPIKGSSATSVDEKDLDTDAYLAKRYPHLIKRK